MNLTRFRQVMDAIDAEPYSLNQRYWMLRRLPSPISGFCGTVMCVAGHTVTQFGFVPVWEPNESLAEECRPKDGGTRRYIEEVAQELLELTEEQKTALFCGENPNDPAFLRHLGEELATTTEHPDNVRWDMVEKYWNERDRRVSAHEEGM